MRIGKYCGYGLFSYGAPFKKQPTLIRMDKIKGQLLAPLLGAMLALFQIGSVQAGPKTLEAAGVEIGQDAVSAVKLLTKKYGEPRVKPAQTDKILTGCIWYANNKNYENCIKLVEQEFGATNAHFFFEARDASGEVEVKISIHTTGPTQNVVEKINYYQYLSADADPKRVQAALFEKYGPNGVAVRGGFVWADAAPPFSRRVKAYLGPEQNRLLLKIELEALGIKQAADKEQRELGIELGKRHFDENGNPLGQSNKEKPPVKLQF